MDRKTRKTLYQFMKLCLTTPTNKQGLDIIDNLSSKLKKNYFLAALQDPEFIKFSENMKIIEHYIKKKFRNTEEIPDSTLELAFHIIIIDMFLYTKIKIQDESFFEDEDAIKMFSSAMKNFVKKGEVPNFMF